MTEPWTPIFGEDEEPNLRAAVFQALGTASLCWSPPPTGQFDTEQAIWVGEGLLRYIYQEFS